MEQQLDNSRQIDDIDSNPPGDERNPVPGQIRSFLEKIGPQAEKGYDEIHSLIQDKDEILIWFLETPEFSDWKVTELTSGAQGIIIIAETPEGRRALKVQSKKSSMDMRMEARAAEAIGEDFAPHIFRYQGKNEGYEYLLMEALNIDNTGRPGTYLQGDHFYYPANFYPQDPKAQLRFTIEFIKNFASAVGNLTNRNIYLGADIKPNNFFFEVGTDGKVTGKFKMLDLAAAYASTTDVQDRTRRTFGHVMPILSRIAPFPSGLFLGARFRETARNPLKGHVLVDFNKLPTQIKQYFARVGKTALPAISKSLDPIYSAGDLARDPQAVGYTNPSEIVLASDQALKELYGPQGINTIVVDDDFLKKSDINERLRIVDREKRAENGRVKSNPIFLWAQENPGVIEKFMILASSMVGGMDYREVLTDILEKGSGYTSIYRVRVKEQAEGLKNYLDDPEGKLIIALEKFWTWVDSILLPQIQKIRPTHDEFDKLFHTNFWRLIGKTDIDWSFWVENSPGLLMVVKAGAADATYYIPEVEKIITRADSRNYFIQDQYKSVLGDMEDQIGKGKIDPEDREIIELSQKLAGVIYDKIRREINKKKMKER